VAPVGAALLNGISMLKLGSAAAVVAAADDPDELAREAAARAHAVHSAPQRLPTLVPVSVAGAGRDGAAPWLTALLLSGASEVMRARGDLKAALTLAAQALRADPGCALAQACAGKAIAQSVLARSPVETWKSLARSGDVLWSEWVLWSKVHAGDIDTAGAVEGASQLTACVSSSVCNDCDTHMQLCGLLMACGRLHDARISMEAALAARESTKGLELCMRRLGLDDAVLGLTLWLGIGVGCP